MRGNNTDGKKIPGGQIGNHAKVLMVDEKVFYIWSDNAYGGGLLAEFGLIVDDAAKSKDFVDNWWTPLWTEAKGENEDGLVSGRNGGAALVGQFKWKTDHFDVFGWTFTSY